MSSRKAIWALAGYLAGAILLWSGCTDEIHPEPGGDEEATRIFASISVQQPGGKAASTRGVLAPDDGEYELGITEAEHQINTLTLIMMQVDADGTETFEATQTLHVPQAVDGKYEVTFDLTGRSGTKRFYVGANLRQAHIGAFGTKDRVFNAGEGATGHNIVGGLMTINHETNGNGKGSNIVMTGIVTGDNGNRDFELPDNPTGKEVHLNITTPVKLTRAVAKVLLTCQSKEGNNDHVNVVDINDKDQSTTDNTGWIRFENVNYMLNVLNRKTYLDYREEGNGTTDTYLTDPNYKISDLIEDRGEEGGYGLEDLNAYRQEFLYYDTQQMVEMLNGDVQILEGIETEPCTTRKATMYDESKIGENSTGHYTEGLYCPENMVYNDLPSISTENLASVNRFVSTRIMVGAKYTPKKIYTDENGTLTVKTASTEDEAKKLLDNANDKGYLSGTFWQDNNTKQYYTLSGMKKKLEEDSGTEFNRYDGGWGYYYTYVDQEANDVIEGNETITRWGVKRNHYYIIKVEKIIAPGSAFPGNEVMRIHSELVEWKDKGSSDIDIDLPQ